jgi:hypothetical protein
LKAISEEKPKIFQDNSPAVCGKIFLKAARPI